MIDRSTGDLSASKDVTIKRFSKEKELIKFLKEAKAEKWDVQNGWVHYYLKNYKTGTQYFFFDFMFYNGLLNRVDFSFYAEPVKNASWDDWSEEKELNKKMEYEEWLTKETSGLTDFDWGLVAAYYDAKGGGSGIMIRYKPIR